MAVDSVQNNGSSGIGNIVIPTLVAGAVGAGSGAAGGYYFTSPTKDEVIFKLGQVHATEAEANAVKRANALKSIVDNSGFDKVAGYTETELNALKAEAGFAGKTGDALKTAAKTQLETEMSSNKFTGGIDKFSEYITKLKNEATQKTFDKLKTSKEAFEKVPEFKLADTITADADKLKAKQDFVREHLGKLHPEITDDAAKTAKIEEIAGKTGAGNKVENINKVFTKGKEKVTTAFTELEGKLKTQLEKAYDVATKKFKTKPEGATEKTAFEQVENAVKAFKKSAALKWAGIVGGGLALLGLIGGFFASRKPKHVEETPQ